MRKGILFSESKLILETTDDRYEVVAQSGTIRNQPPPPPTLKKCQCSHFYPRLYAHCLANQPKVTCINSRSVHTKEQISDRSPPAWLRNIKFIQLLLVVIFVIYWTPGFPSHLRLSANIPKENKRITKELQYMSKYVMHILWNNCSTIQISISAWAIQDGWVVIALNKTKELD